MPPDQASMDIAPRFLDAGEAALVVEFGDAVEPAINEHVLALDEALASLAVQGVLETVPTYRSLMIHYDPLIVDRENLIEKIRAIEARARSSRHAKNRWTIPCCYEPAFGEDLAQIAEAAHLTAAQTADLHASAIFRVYMYGFAPGCCYLGGIPGQLAISRRPAPRPPYPSNSILIAGGLSLISTVSMPTGWWVIGRTPVRLFAPQRDPIFLVQVGDLIRFQPIGEKEFNSLEKLAVSGEVVAEREILR